MKTKYKNKTSLLQCMDMSLYNKLSLALDKLPNNVTRTDLINSFIKNGLSLKDKEIQILVGDYKKEIL